MGGSHQEGDVTGAAQGAGAATAVFRDFLEEARPVRLREPLAELLGAFSGGEAVIEYSITDAVKMAGHCCPTVTGAYLSCQVGLEALYGEEIPVRGEIAVTVFGEPDEGVYGVMGQVLGLITGAAPETGFKGLGGRYKRKDLLSYVAETPDPSGASFEFRRLDTGKSVLVNFYPWAIPFPDEKAQRAGELMDKTLAGVASGDERKEFQDLWMEKIKWMLERKDIQSWLKVTER